MDIKKPQLVKVGAFAYFFEGVLQHPPGDIENAVNVASKIGDDYLQRKAYGKEMPESFNHGRSSQRVKWLTRGLNSGDPTLGDTFSPSYSAL